MDFHCPYCKHACRVWVAARGRGAGTAPFFLDGDSAAARASERAEVDVRDNLLETLSLATCPKCWRRSASAHAWNIVKSAVAAVALAACGFVSGWAADLPMALAVGGAATLGLGVFTALQHKRLTVERRLAFPPSDRPRVSLPAAALPTPVPAAARGVAERDPFRSPPGAKPIEAIQVARPAAASPVVAPPADAEPVDGPKLLK
jgi:hypothetical protein